MGNDDAKRLILARRARFVAAALAGVAVAGAEGCGKSSATPPCLSPPPNDPDAAIASPEPCLSVPLRPTPPVDPDAAPPPRPQPCLKIKPPGNE